MSHSQKTLSKILLANFLFGVSLVSNRTAAEADVRNTEPPNSSWPTALVLPWQALNIDADQVRLAAKALEQSQLQLATAVADDVAALSTRLPQSTKTDLNTKGIFKHVLSGTLSKDLRLPSPRVAFTPIWAKAQNRQLLILTLSTSDSNIILASTHRLVGAEAWQKNQANGSLANVFSPLLLEMKEEIASLTITIPNPDLAIGLAVGAVSNKNNEMERNTLNLITAVQHLTDFTIVNPIGAEILASIHRAWKANGPLRRPNRTLSMSWFYDIPTAKMAPGALNLKLKVKPLEAVFGQEIRWSVEEDVSIDTTGDQRLQIALSKKLSTELATEAKALTRSQNPQASKIYGAWVYLDKGRAWGLRMNDRLVISDGSETVKGHIVGYYGPEQQLKSPRGWPIQEGAIMFVRKGQRESKLGQEFLYDKMSVPTAWPPRGSTK